MFSTSMIASSTTTPTAITKPARIMVLMAAPLSRRIIAPASSDNGIAARLISAVRHSNRNRLSTAITSRQPSSSARLRLSSATSIKSAGRKRVGSISRPGSPGRSAASASSTPCVTSSVLAHGNFSTTSISPGPSLIIASPISGWWPSTTLAMSLRRSGVPSARCLPLSGTCARSSGLAIGDTCWMPSRWLPVSINPPVPITAPLENWSRPTSSAPAVASIASASETSCARMRMGSSCTCGIFSRSPQMATLATPGTRSSRARIVQ